MSGKNAIGASRDVRYVPPPSTLNTQPVTGYASTGQHINRDQIGLVDSNGSKEKATVERIETIKSDPGIVRPKKKGIFARLWAHYKRYFCCYFIAGVVLAAVLLPVFFLVIFPAVAQLMVNKSPLPIYSATIVKPALDSIEYSLKGSLNIPKPFKVHMDPITLSLFDPENKTAGIVPYAKVGLYYPDGADLQGNASVDITAQRAAILDKEVFHKFLEKAVYSETFELAAYGETTAYLGKLKAKLKVDKRVELNGLNNLKGFAINSARLVFPPEEDGTNFIGNITLPNASIVTFELGNVTLNLKIGGVIMGYAQINDAFLVPGNNTVIARGAADIKTMLKNIPLIIAAEAAAIAKGNIELSASGNSTVYNGIHIDYFERVLNKLDMTAQMPILSVLLDTVGGFLGNNGGITNILDFLKGINITDLLPLIMNLGGSGGGDNSSGSSLLTILGLKAKRHIQHLPVRLPVPITVKVRRDADSFSPTVEKKRDVASTVGELLKKKDTIPFAGEKRDVAGLLGELLKKNDVASLSSKMMKKRELSTLMGKMSKNKRLAMLISKAMEKRKA